jgi:hypothetical protein
LAGAGFEGEGEGDEADLRDGTDEAVEVARRDIPSRVSGWERVAGLGETDLPSTHVI